MEQQLVIRVFGKVQGVWFRQSAKETADKLGVRGIVMNEPDGSVYIKARGTEKKLGSFLSFCKTGPEDAEVDNVLVAEDDELTAFRSFEIIR